ncbi:MAG: sensor histidine kinase [Bacteroidetes bacterium]|nr:sensor histidine kinase [Bacteroidota bacterium]
MKDELIDKIANTSILFIAFMVLPFNAIIYVALDESVYLWPRFVPPVLGLAAIILAFLKSRMNFSIKIWSFIVLLFLSGCFNLILGLLDMASLWFVLAIVYSLFTLKRMETLGLFIISFIAILVVGILMITKSTFIPLDYHFENCQYTCVIVRILHFLLIGFLIYYILVNFYSRLQASMNELTNKADDLEVLNIALNNEISEKKEIQQKMIESVIQTEEKERKRIAADLHDGLGPLLSAAKLYFQAYIDAGDLNGKNEIESKLKYIIDHAIADISRISHNISPHILENYGLTIALENFLGEFMISDSIKVELNVEKFSRFDLKKELTIYRTISELINNTIKHAKATLVAIDIFISGRMLHLVYQDNGIGFSVDEKMQAKQGMGLKNIESRIHSFEGNVIFESRQNKGMKVTIQIPYQEILIHEKN